MSQVNALLTQRTKKGENTSKMAEMARQSANGNLTSFSGVFSIAELNDKEKEILEILLKNHSKGSEDISKDLHSLISITSEVKAINNQAAILHGERIKRAHSLLIKYRDGAFTAWLMAAYGNRQTPYNFLQYYEFHESIPKNLRQRLETMPRQAIYTLASREGSFEKKRQIVELYKGESKTELMTMIREVFPIDNQDKRSENFGEGAIQNLKKIAASLQSPRATLTKLQKREIEGLLDQIRSIVENG